MINLQYVDLHYHFCIHTPIFQIFIILGKLLLVHHPEQLCGHERSEKDELKNKSSSTLVVKFAPSPGADDPQDHAQATSFARQLKMITNWISQKERSDEIIAQWCHVISVIDRVLFICCGLLAIGMTARLIDAH